jgi:glycosyltransferase involved in cell wall biosynthesis
MVVDPRDAAAVAEAMLALADGERAAALGAAALEHAALLTWPMVAQRLVRALAPADVDVHGLAAFL